MAEEAKAKGNAALSAGDFSGAVRHLSDAIALDPTDNFLYSSRSTAYSALHNYSEAFADAMKNVELSAALIGLAHCGSAASAFEKFQGLDYDPNNKALVSGLAPTVAEHRNPDSLMQLHMKAAKAAKDLDQLQHFDPKLANEQGTQEVSSYINKYIYIYIYIHQSYHTLYAQVILLFLFIYFEFSVSF